MVDLNEIQKQATEWAERNFGKEDPLVTLLVAQGELGELAQAHVHSSRGIRGKTKRDIMDAVGDTIISLMGYCSPMGLEIEDCLLLSLEDVIPRDWKRFPENGRS